MAGPAPISVYTGANRSERRRKPRKSAISLSLVTVEMDTNGFGLMLDVSEDGASVQVMNRVEPASLVQIAFKLPEMESRIEGTAKVAWCDGGGRAGLQFNDFKSEGSEELKRWIESLPEAFSDSPTAPVPDDANIKEQMQAIRAQMASANLDTESVLQLLLERIAELTRCNGAAIALGESDRMVCRASTGLAPDIGVVIGSGSALTAECLQTGKIVRCDDTEADVRVDEEICRELSLRSAVIVPIYFQGRMRGVLEVFSPVPNAFDDHHVRLLQHFAEFTAESAFGPKPAPAVPAPVSLTAAPAIKKEAASPVAKASQAQPASGNGSTAAPATESVSKFAGITEPVGSAEERAGHKDSLRTWRRVVAIVATVILVAAICCIGWWYGRVNASKAVLQSVTTPSAPPPASSQEQPLSTPASASSSQEPINAAKPKTAQQTSPSESSTALVAADVVRSPRAAVVLADPTTPLVLASSRQPAPKTPDVPAEAPSINVGTNASLREITLPVNSTSRPNLSPLQGVVTGGTLIHRVEPAYPPFARQQRVQGVIELTATVRKDGTVGNVKRIRGNPILEPAAIAAVRQWRYEPYKLNGQPQDVDISIAVQFRLQQ